ncbi:1-acyl-sn-glycerol-3-phosphate acyltransferase [Pedobacter sp. MW01-1-1]|uniref:1-acyl-sn-glycerol-3-phosphate acyltransferase n=1 Tax=Pedobacter sp. MW01-1-1 TaxID=3383027 RepID=UPI003FEDB306
MIKEKSLPASVLRLGGKMLSWYFRRKFAKISIETSPIRPNHSYVLMCNHFSFWDGFLACFLIFNAIDKRHKLKGLKIMILEKQLKMNKWLRYIGCFSIVPGIRAQESLKHAIDILNEPGNLLLIFPQGNLESLFIRTIKFKEGISAIVPKVKTDCQLIWSSNFIEYFESLKPRLYFNMLDCGNNTDFDFNNLVNQVNVHHVQAMRKNVRFTFSDFEEKKV